MRSATNYEQLLLKLIVFGLLFPLTLLSHEAWGQSHSGSDSATASITPWSGYWWPLKNGGTATGKDYRGEPAPLQKYDAVSGIDGSATKWELENHYDPDGASWFGHCHAWAAASILDEEPTEQVNEFFVGDQKAFLTELHYSDLAHYVGNRYNGPGDDRNDIYPDQFNSVLFDYIKKQGKPVVMDLESGEEVWNYPVYRYDMQWRSEGNRKYFETRIWYAGNNVSPDAVGTQEGTKVYRYYYEDTDDDGIFDHSAWLGTSVEDHPDFAWDPYQRRGDNPHLKPDIVEKIIAGQLTSLVDVVPPSPPPTPAPETTPSPPSPEAETAPGTPTSPTAPPPPPPQPAITPQPPAPPTPPAPRLTVKVWGDGGNRLGDEVKIYFKASLDSYITLFDIGSSGKVIKLFPNRFDAENFIRGGRTYQLPKKDAGYRVKVDPSGPRGVEAVVAVATPGPKNLTFEDLSIPEPGRAISVWTFEIR